MHALMKTVTAADPEYPARANQRVSKPCTSSSAKAAAPSPSLPVWKIRSLLRLRRSLRRVLV